MPLELYPFRYRDPRTGNWVRARYKAEREVIAERYAEWEITGPAEIRSGPGIVMFSPSYKLVTHAEMRAMLRASEPPLELNPHLAKPPTIDAFEIFLLRRFLRRYITYCARRRQFAQMNGAARLFAEVRVALVCDPGGANI